MFENLKCLLGYWTVIAKRFWKLLVMLIFLDLSPLIMIGIDHNGYDNQLIMIYFDLN